MPRRTSLPPPHERKLILVDFDGTIVPWGPLMGLGLPYPGVAESIRLLREAGWKVMIFTSRASPEWWATEAAERGVPPELFGARQVGYVRNYLRHYGIEHDGITAEKVAARVYFDDRAWRVEPGALAADLMMLYNDGRMTTDV